MNARLPDEQDTEAGGGQARIGRALRNASEALRGQCDDAHADLDRLDVVMSDAIGRLLASFQRVADEAARVQELAAAATPGEGAAPQPLRSAAQGVADGVAQAVVALQFQDLAAQLIAHARRRWSDAQATAGELGCLARALETGTAAEAGGALERLHESVGAMAERGARVPVRQRRLDAGSIELF